MSRERSGSGAKVPGQVTLVPSALLQARGRAGRDGLNE